MNILLTGVSKGLGLVTAEVLLKEGNSVFGVSRSLTPALQSLLDTYPEHFFWKEYAIGQGNDVRNDLFKSWIGFKTPLHAFINNAAVAYDDIITNMDEERLLAMYQTNVLSPLIITKYAIRQMLLHNVSGSIVHLSSISVHTGYKGLSMYASTKGALEAFSKNTAREWGEKGIRSNCLVAGFMETEMSSTLSADQKNRIYLRTSMKTPVQAENEQMQNR